MAADLSKVRKVLDYVPTSKMGNWKDRHYFEALNRRLNREVIVEMPQARPARDEAVMIVPPEQWDAAQEAQERQASAEAELQQMRDEVDRVQERERELQEEVEQLRSKLGTLRVEAEAKKKVALQLVGVRRATPIPAETVEPAALEPPPEEAEVPSWEAVPEEPVNQEQALAEAGWEVVPPQEAKVQAAEAEASEAEAAIQRVEAEIEKIEKELATLAGEERERGRKGPYRTAGYTLYRRTVGRGDNAREFYFFSKEAPEDGTPAALPEGHSVGVNAKTGVPTLKATAKAAKKRGKKARKKGKK